LRERDTENLKRRERDATSLLRKVQEEGRDQGREAGHLEEQEACGQRLMPVLRDKGIPDREGLVSFFALHSIQSSCS
jgi:hypothetical protein